MDDLPDSRAIAPELASQRCLGYAAGKVSLIDQRHLLDRKPGVRLVKPKSKAFSRASDCPLPLGRVRSELCLAHCTQLRQRMLLIVKLAMAGRAEPFNLERFAVIRMVSLSPRRPTLGAWLRDNLPILYCMIQRVAGANFIYP